jgi:hypothetical protein
MTGELPYATKAEPTLFHEVLVKKNLPSRPDYFFQGPDSNLGDALWLVLTQCWNHNATSRPTAAQVRIHVSIQATYSLKALPPENLLLS